MAKITFTELIDGFKTGGERAVTAIERRDTLIAELRTQLAAAGVPDDQVPPPPQDDAALVAFLGRLNELDPVEPTEPGADVLPDVDELPTVPAEPTA
jgi:SOS response regulatory protein OraA/RecX